MKKIFLSLVCLLFFSNLYATNPVVNLDVNYKTVSFAGKTKTAIAINNQIPGPTLHFKEGDQVTINVRNHLKEETAIHWHGILVPWQMDGVLGITQKGIPPGGIFQYRFTLQQTGTYWYHAHAGLQEQQGLYGAFVIDPQQKPPYYYTKDFAVILSDWQNTNPNQILANLKKSGDYYSPRFPLQASLTKFIHDYYQASTAERQQLLDDYKMMQQMRMSIYDISDVAYDAFLLNGHTKSSPWIGHVNTGDIVRLRFIGAGGSTIFHVKIPENTMQIVHVDGNDVKPYSIQDLTIAPGETYDVLVQIKNNGPYFIYVESVDKVGSVYGALVTTESSIENVKITPFPEPLPVTREMMLMMMGNMDHGSMNHDDMHEHMSMDDSHKMSMSTEPSIIGDKMSRSVSSYTSAETKYKNMTAALKTNDPHKPIKDVIQMELFGYMDHFIWFINGLPEYKAKPIVLEPSKRYRIIFTNHSMMHHPMHIHGHWFILRKGEGAYDPLLHTIDVPPGATITVDLDTDASGQWFFHCHLLYHMVAGMSRVIQYSSLIELSNDEIKPQNIVKKTAFYNRPIVEVDEIRPIDRSLVRHPMAHSAGWYFATFLDVGDDPFHSDQRLTYKGLYGHDYNKLELFINDAEMDEGTLQNADVDIFYWHLIKQFWTVKAGVNYTYRPAEVPYWQPGIGIEGLMPYFIDTEVRSYYHDGSVKLDVEFSRDTQITNNFFIRFGLRSILASKTVNRASIGSGLNQMRYALRPYYRLTPGLNVYAEYEHQQNYGVFKNNQINLGESAVENTVTLGLSFIL